MTLPSQRYTNPLFIVLRKQWFREFQEGTKTEEWRRYGPRWNAQSCWIGRRVTLSLGYTTTRLTGNVISFDVRPATGGAIEIYGQGTQCAVIGIRIDHRQRK